jgi:NADH-quinone oxidoreductase subunit L
MHDHGHGHDDHGHHHADHAHGHDSHGHDDGTLGYHPHAAPWVMTLPLVLLAIGAVFAGFVFAHTFLEPEFWQGAVAYSAELHEKAEHLPTLVGLAPTIVMLIGLAVAYWAYIADTTIPARFTATFRGLYLFLLNKWYFDELYDFLFVRPAFAIGRFFWKKGDEGTIDRFGPDGISKLVVVGNRFAARAQSGYVYSYALVMLLGLAGIATWAMTR